MIFRPSEEDEEDSDYDDIYVPFSGMKIVANNVAVEGMEYTDVNASERGGADAVVDSETSDARAHAEEGRKYQNLWSSEDDPRAVPLPDPNLICPTHHIACKKGICADMSKILRDMKKAQLKAEWEEKQKNRGTPCFFFFFLFFLFLLFPHNARFDLLQAEKRRVLRGAVITTLKKVQPRLMEITTL